MTKHRPLKKHKSRVRVVAHGLLKPGGRRNRMGNYGRGHTFSTEPSGINFKLQEDIDRAPPDTNNRIVFKWSMKKDRFVFDGLPEEWEISDNISEKYLIPY